MSDILSYAELVAALDSPGVLRGGVTYTALTRSIMGREIPLITVGQGERAVLYVGGHHGTEGATTAILLDFILDCIRQRERHSTVFEYSIDYLFEKRKLYIVPMLNPDGAEYVSGGVDSENPLYRRLLTMNEGEDFSSWQANARGVDLEHNYATGFLEYRQEAARQGILNGAPHGYGGEYPESEPETAALCRLLRLRREEIVGVLSLHGGEHSISCCCREKLTAKTMAAGRALARLCGYRLEHPDQTKARGRLGDWCIRELGRPAYRIGCGHAGAGGRQKGYESLRRALFSFPFLV